MPRLVTDAEVGRFLETRPTPRPPRPIEVSTDPAGCVRLSVPHDTQGNTATGCTSEYCTTLTLTAERWREVLEAVGAKLPEEKPPPLLKRIGFCPDCRCECFINFGQCGGCGYSFSDDDTAELPALPDHHHAT
jgi:hypothetical protein